MTDTIFPTNEELLQLFPITADITQDIIDNSQIYDTRKCIGANTLKSCVPVELHKYIEWGASTGSIDMYISNVYVIISTTEDIDMMNVISPTTVTFTAKLSSDNNC